MALEEAARTPMGISMAFVLETSLESRPISERIEACCDCVEGKPIIPRTVRFFVSRGNKIASCVPFISDSISSAVQRCIARAQLQEDARLVRHTTIILKVSFLLKAAPKESLAFGFRSIPRF